MAGVSPSQFNRPFRFEIPAKTATISGGRTEEFNLLFNARGKWTQQSGTRNFGDGDDTMVTIYTVTTYWRSVLEANLNKDTRLIYENRIYKISSIERIGEQRQYYQLTVSEAH